jgi:hypothetical protein
VGSQAGGQPEEGVELRAGLGGGDDGADEGEHAEQQEPRGL